MKEERLPKEMLWFVAAAFFLSGFAALTYEIVWQRVLVRVLGATTPAMSTIVCAFMGGLGLGAALGTRLARRKNLLITLALVELFIAICALGSILICKPAFIQFLNQLLSATANDGIAVSPFGFILIFLLIFIPTALMGATFPVIAAIVSQAGSNGSRLLMKFYAVNSSGAVFGAFVSGFFFVPLLGISKTLLATAAFNLLASALSYSASRDFGQPGYPSRPTPLSSNDPDSSDASLSTDPPFSNEDLNSPQSGSAIPARRERTRFLALLVLTTAAMAFVMEIVWSRFLVLLFGSSTYALSLVLSVFIAGLSLGAWIATIIGRRAKDKFASISFVLATTSTALALNLFQYQAAPAFYLNLKKFFLTSVGTGFWADTSCMMMFSISLVLLPATLIGIVFPLILGISSNTSRKNDTVESNLARHASILYCASVSGSMIGSFGCGVLLLPAMAERFTSGIEETTMLMAVGYVLAALIVLFVLRKSLSQAPPGAEPNKPGVVAYAANIQRFTLQIKGVIILIVATTVMISIRPQWDSALMSSGLAYVSDGDVKTIALPDLLCLLGLKEPFNQGQELLMYREGVNSTVSVISNTKTNLVYLKNNGKVEGAIPIDPRLPAIDSDLPTQKLLGLIPALNCRGDSLDGLVIGCGTGTTCGAIESAPWVRNLTCVEIEKSIWDARRYFLGSAVLGTKIRFPSILKRVTADARSYIAMNKSKYDFIVSQPAEPWLSGASDLYTVEFYQLARQRLKDSGMFCQWIPLYSLTKEQLTCLLKTFQSVFPETTIWHSSHAGELILTGEVGSLADREVIDQRISAAPISLQLQRIGIEDRFGLAFNAIAFPENLRRTKAGAEESGLNTDDNLIVEGMLAEEMSSRDSSIDANLRQVIDPNKSDSKTLERLIDNHELAQRTVIGSLRRAEQQFTASDAYYFPVLEAGGPSDEKHGAGATNSVKIEDNNPVFSATIDKDRFELSYFLYSGQIGKAAQVLSSIAPSRADSYSQLCDMATVEFMTGNYEQSLSTFESAVQRQAIGARALAGEGLCYWMMRRWSDAIVPLTESLKIDPNQFLARYALAQTLYHENRKTEALIQMRAAGQVNSQSPWPGIFVTANYISEGNLDSASTNLHLVMRKKQYIPQAIALGFLLGEQTARKDLRDNFKNRYRDLTTRDITITEAKQLVKTIMTEPYIVKAIAAK